MTLEEILEDWKLILSSHVNAGIVVDRFIDEHTGHLTHDDICTVLDCLPGSEDQYLLHSFACAVRQRCYGRKLFVRGVIEITNRCDANCNYCQMCSGNENLERYTLDDTQIIQAAKEAQEQGITTLMLQGGEYNAGTSVLVAGVIQRLKKDLGFKIILSLGSFSKDVYSRWRFAGVESDFGADAYIIKFETSSKDHHEYVRNCKLKDRLACIDALLEMGYSVGSGLISDLPHPPSENPHPKVEVDRIATDILLVQERQFSLCSVSPFIKEKYTEFSNLSHPNGSLNRALNIIALLRIANPTSLIPSVSAFEMEMLKGSDKSHSGQGRGIKAGANVITINFTPKTKRDQYKIYGDDRYVVTHAHVKKIASETDLILFYGDSTGPRVLGCDDETEWFSKRYSDPLPLASSVYGAPSDLGLKYLRYAKDFLDDNKKTKKNILPNLDLGGGDGRYAIPMMLQGVSVRLIDTCPQSLLRLHERMQHFEIHKDLLRDEQGDVRSLDLTESCSSVTIANLLYYLSDEDILAVLTRALKALVPEGLLYISVEVAPVLELLNTTDAQEPPTYFRIASQQNYTTRRLLDLIEKACAKAGTTLLHYPDPDAPHPLPWFDSVQLPCHHKRFPGYKSYARRYNVAEFLYQKRAVQQ